MPPNCNVFIWPLAFGASQNMKFYFFSPFRIFFALFHSLFQVNLSKMIKPFKYFIIDCLLVRTPRHFSQSFSIFSIVVTSLFILFLFSIAWLMNELLFVFIIRSLLSLFYGHYNLILNMSDIFWKLLRIL